MFIPRIDSIKGKSITEITLEEIAEMQSAEALNLLLTKGGEGIKQAMSFAIGMAVSKVELEREENKL